MFYYYFCGLNYIYMDKFSAITNPVAGELEQFRMLFESSLVSSNSLLNQALIHIKQRGGKMMRPILVLLIAKLFGKITNATFHSAVALELLHTASLVHDDVVDESDQRRGQASVNAIYNNKVSVLVGDFLLATCLVHASHTCSEQIVEVIARLGQDLSEGEILQLSNVSSAALDEKVYFDVIKKKTAALFAACTKAAALSVDASEKEVEEARLFGEYVGICFQIKDDIFDYYNNLEIGKPTGNDMREGKLTLPAIHVLNRTQDAEALRLAARVKSGDVTNEEIVRLIDFVKQNKGIEYALNVMMEYKDRAEKLVSRFKDAAIKDALICYLNYVVERIK